MWFLYYLSYLGILIQLLFITLGLFAGLYYLAELAEEYSTQAKKSIWWTNAVVTILYVLLWIFEEFPAVMIICGLMGQIGHFLILRSFPRIVLTSIEFILSGIFLVVNHYYAFENLAEMRLTFAEIISYFVIYLWLVPFSLFVSLTINDAVLPTTTTDGDVVSNYFSNKRKVGLLTIFAYAKDSLLPTRTKKIF